MQSTDMTALTETQSGSAELIDELVGGGSLDELIPALARDAATLLRIERHVQQLHTRHEIIRGDARRLDSLPSSSVHLVVTSPPYWTLKRYNDHDDQLGHVDDYDEFLSQLDQVWKHCFRALVPGGRLNTRAERRAGGCLQKGLVQ
jgi:tRNA1(Val) A37 N6-methylase TrmN6